MSNRKRGHSANRRAGGLPTVLVLLITFGGFGYLLWQNSEAGAPLQAVVPTQSAPTEEINPWGEVLRDGFGENSTPLPTIPIPTELYVPPTLPGGDLPTITPFAAANLSTQTFVETGPVSVGIVPSLPPATAENGSVLLSAGTAILATVQSVPTPNLTWQPPPLQPPLNRDPQGRDHYFFIRPVDSNAANFGIFYYSYGSDGQQEANPLRVHHGIDMSNPVGQTIRAGLSGTVVFASSVEDPYFQNTFSYGNVVVIEHDYGWLGNRLFSLYAHLQEAVVQTGQYVTTGQAIGINGNTGQVTGPHVHFEVRMTSSPDAIPQYGETYNPLLWMVPYVGHGTIAGLLVDERGDTLDDYDITLRNVSTTLLQSTTTTYIFDDTVNQVNPDPNWGENFVFGDVPVGRYEVVATVNGLRVAATVTVSEGMTSFVDLRPNQPDVALAPGTGAVLPSTPASTLPATPPGG